MDRNELHGLDGLDGALARLRAAAERIGINLLELDQAPTRTLLDAAPLRGGSAARWAEARTTLAELFQSYAALNAVVEQAVAARGSRASVSPGREAELARLLTGPSVEVPGPHVPIDERDLLAASTLVRRCTPDELVAQMAERFDLVRQVIASAAEVWQGELPRLRAQRERAQQLAGLARGFGGPVPAALDRVPGRLEGLERVMLADPLAFDTGELDAVARQLDRASVELDRARDARDHLEDHLSAAHVMLDELRDAVPEGESARRDTVARFRTGAARTPLAADPALAAELDRISRLAADGRWSEVDGALARWRQQVGEQLERANAAIVEHRRLLDERAELRGRLDAYQAKVARLGRLEADELSALHARAENLLYTAPTDLVLAGEAVRQYQAAVSATADGRTVAS